MMTPAAAVATILSDANLADYRPHPALGGDVCLENWSPVAPSDGVLVGSVTARTTHGLTGYESTVKVTCRGDVNTMGLTYQRAIRIYNALKATVVPCTVDTLTVQGIWADPPLVQRLDVAGRPEVILLVRVRHGDL